MAADGASGAAFGLGLKTGAIASLMTVAVSLMAVCLGFTVVPLKAGDEHRDAVRRLAGGLLCSFILGFPLAFKAIDLFPWLLTPWQHMLADQHPLMTYLAAASPFLAVTAVPGFWVVAAWMRFFTKREGQDLLDMAREARDAIAGGAPRE
jgi:hypothetical protein